MARRENWGEAGHPTFHLDKETAAKRRKNKKALPVGLPNTLEWVKGKEFTDLDGGLVRVDLEGNAVRVSEDGEDASFGILKILSWGNLRWRGIDLSGDTLRKMVGAPTNTAPITTPTTTTTTAPTTYPEILHYLKGKIIVDADGKAWDFDKNAGFDGGTGFLAGLHYPVTVDGQDVTDAIADGVIIRQFEKPHQGRKLRGIFAK